MVGRLSFGAATGNQRNHKQDEKDKEPDLRHPQAAPAIQLMPRTPAIIAMIKKIAVL